MNVAFLCLGGNMGDRMAFIEQAKLGITANCGNIIGQSSVYETEAWGNEGQPGYYNQCIKIETGKEAFSLMECLLNVENMLGRTRSDNRNESRTIDIDILLFNNEILNEFHCHIPHQRMHLRRFVLVPLCELAADVEHPVFHKTIRTLLKECPDRLEVKKVS